MFDSEHKLNVYTIYNPKNKAIENSMKQKGTDFTLDLRYITYHTHFAQFTIIHFKKWCVTVCNNYTLMTCTYIAKKTTT